ncbi:hydantoin utilization protein A [Thermacetogenium phaeum DSM 12270]|uniref:Hydantoin utilization protein A n=1 Tax=Thermacetogenium phaeum (strain ATCC BAA-254 / DSM 26808 / PB) TaxID=1089553 RepID=K4LUA5_THEPS|nr:hydantoinase/oxoprolinase family protein [Thermacetogenium phaeum]AFV11604.1 hydantoin utilization protein A [Thermacetogenium phaeum DSM 12270]
MLIGLDVGGTYTDAVLLEGREIIKKVKTPTDYEKLLNSLLAALDPLLEEAKGRAIERIVLSTTLITNLIATRRIEPVALVLIPGPGLNPDTFDYQVPLTISLSGAIDYRGREIEPLNEQELKECMEKIKDSGVRRIAVVGKFSQRNNKHEQKVATYLQEHIPDLEVIMGHQVTGRLNYPRRVYTTLLTLATQRRFREFYSEVQELLHRRGIKAPLYILKADGGTLPLEQSAAKPVETIFSGPAASTMGVLALTPRKQTSVVIDIGGTTTDLALILTGTPLLASKGARIDDQLTHVRAFATKSVAVGGDSCLRVRNGSLEILPYREGPAYCLGGPQPTPTDAMRVAGLTDIGDKDKAIDAMKILGKDLGLSVNRTAELTLKMMVRRITAEINSMFLAWEQEPAYRIWELRQKRKVRPQNLVGIGAASPALIPLLSKEMDCRPVIPQHAEVANAIGAALARVNLRLTFHFDTERNFYFIEENGVQERIPEPLHSLQDAEKFALGRLKEEGKKLGIITDDEPEIIYSELFNMVRGWRTTGRLIDVCVQFPTGVLVEWEEGGN